MRPVAAGVMIAACADSPYRITRWAVRIIASIAHRINLSTQHRRAQPGG
jgi:hypothetical protein